MKKAVCISCGLHYAERTRFIEQCLTQCGYDCTYITSDFNHNTKKTFKIDHPSSIQIPTMPYAKNLSVQRLLSHLRFSRDALKAASRLNPDLLYVEIPPNSLSRAAAKYKKKHPNVKLIFDIFDMWPEGFPSKRAKQLLRLPFRVWGYFRDTGLPVADLVLTECDLFRRKLEKQLKDIPAEVLLLCRSEATAQTLPTALAEDALHLCYLGAINNIIDIPCIAGLISELQALKPVVLHIIGDGESREQLIAQVKNTGAEVIYHGKIYDTAEKQKIFDICHFGINIMKDSVCVGLTMKSLDYFAAGLPILNSIEADTWELVERENIGLNICRENLSKTAKELLAVTPEQIYQMRVKTLDIFYRDFHKSVFYEKFKNIEVVDDIERNEGPTAG